MRKSVTKIVKAVLGFAMAIGAGVGAIASKSATTRLNAAAGDEITSVASIVSGKKYFIKGKRTNGTIEYLSFTDSTGTSVTGTGVSSTNTAQSVAFVKENSSWYIKTGSNYYLYPGTSNGKLIITTTKTAVTLADAKWNTSEGAASGYISIAHGDNYLQKNKTAANFGRYANTQNNITLVEAASFGTLDHVKVGTPATKLEFEVGETFSSSGLVLIGYDGANEATANSTSYSSGYTTSLDGHKFVNGDIANNKTVTVTYSGKTTTYTINVVAGPDCVVDGKDNLPSGIGTDTSTTATGEGQINSAGVKYGYYGLAVYSNNLEFNHSVEGAYIGNNESYGKYISKIRVTLVYASDFSKLTMYKGGNSIPNANSVSTTTNTGTVRTYDFGDDSEFFALKQTTTSDSQWIQIVKIELFLGSGVPVINTVSATVKSGTYYAGATLSVSDFEVTVTWTNGKADTHPVSGFTWTVNGINNGALEEREDNSVVLTYEGVESDPFNVIGSPAAAKDVIASTLDSTSNLTYRYNATVNTETDIFDNGAIGVSGTDYVTWSDLADESNAVYAGNTSGGDPKDPRVQLRSKNSDSGIVSTTSGGTIKSITIVWHDSAESGTLDVYGKNTAYSAATELYDNNTKGTKLGSITFGGSTSLDVDGDYSYIGLRSSSGAIYLESISIEWATDKTYSYSNVAVKFGGSISTALWNRLASESNGILGYGVMLATEDYLSGLTIKNYYDLARDEKADVDSVFTEVDGKDYTLVDGLSIKCFYNEVSTMPRLVNGNYVWDLVKGVNNTNAALTKGYTAVAFIRTVDDEIIFLQETTKSAAQVAKDIINADPDDEYNNDYLDGSLGHLAGLAA